MWFSCNNFGKSENNFSEGGSGNSSPGTSPGVSLPQNHMKPANILLVEDDDGDAELFSKAINGTLTNKLVRVEDGESAINYLTENAENENLCPGLIFLDLNLPGTNGREVLKFIKQHSSLKHIPVIVLTTSASNKDIEESYRNQAACFITKPLDFHDFASAIKSLRYVWLEVVSLPRIKAIDDLKS